MIQVSLGAPFIRPCATSKQKAYQITTTLQVCPNLKTPEKHGIRGMSEKIQKIFNPYNNKTVF